MFFVFVFLVPGRANDPLAGTRLRNEKLFFVPSSS